MRAKMEYGLDILVRMLYLEPAVRQRRILVLGQRAEEMRVVLERMGAASVKTHVPGSSRPLPWDLAGLRGKRDVDYGSSLPVRKGEVDLVFIPDLAEVEDYRAMLAEASRALGPEGLLMVSVRNAECTVPMSSTGFEDAPEMWSLDSLEQLLAQYFTYVEVTGQSPFLGYAMASYDATRGRQGVRLDTSLMDAQGEDPEFIVALCATRPPADPPSNALFQVPVAEMALVQGSAPARTDGETAEERRLRSELESVKRELGNRNVIVSRLEKEIERLEGAAEGDRQRMFDLRQKMERERKDHQKEAIESVMRREVEKTPETWLTERATLSRELEEQTRERTRAEKALRELTEQLEKAEARAERTESREKDARARMERSETRARELHVQVKQLTARLREEETRVPEMGRRIQELEASVDRAEKELGLVRSERDELLAHKAMLERQLAKARDEAHGLSQERERELTAEIERLRRELDEKPVPPPPVVDDAELARLGALLEQREELVRDLIRELEVLPSIIDEGRGDAEEGTHRLVGELERARGENEDLSKRLGELSSRLDELQAQLEKARQESAEAAALVTMVDDALGSGPAAIPAAESGPPGPSLDRFLRDLQEDLRRVAGDPKAQGVARDIGQLWVNIEKKRRMT